MRRILLPSRLNEDRDLETIDTTPLRGSSVRFPRLRLLDKDVKSGEYGPRCSTSSYHSATLNPSKIVKTYPFLAPKQVCSDDRFILHRRKYNLEAANYLLTKKATNTLQTNHLDVLKQVDSLDSTWRKKCMHRLMVKENVIPGVSQKQVLRGSHLSPEKKLPGSLVGQPTYLWDDDNFEDGIWKSLPRKRPLIGTVDSILDMPGCQMLSRFRQNLIDWSSKNVIAAATQTAITFFDIGMHQTAETLENVEIARVCCLKWNHAGDKIVICTISCEIKLFCVENQKFIWSVSCITELNSAYNVRCVCWSGDDKHIITGCGGLIMIYLAKTGSIIKTVFAHTRSVGLLVFSTNYRYLASSSPDTNVRVFLWPSMAPSLDITYYEPVKALAWHPDESNLLCIGGGLGDASLCLWHINKLESVSYRLVEFHGAVENLAWNKLSGELVVHWSYWEGQNQYTVMPVLASLDRVVDVLPVDKELRVTGVMWSADQTQIATLSEESLSMWNFFGHEYHYQSNPWKKRQAEYAPSNKKTISSTQFKHFTIR